MRAARPQTFASLVGVALLAGGGAGLAAAAGAAALRPDVPYIDAHSHLLDAVTPEDEISRFRRAGLAGVVIMHPDAKALQEVAARHPGYVIPWISVARTPQMVGLRLDDHTASAMADLYRQGAACGFGELPTRLQPNPDPDDATAFANPYRQQIYALAERHRAPVNVHVSLETPEVVASVEAVAAAHPHMPLVLAHAGWMADAPLIGRLLEQHPNLYADLSVRLDPPAEDSPTRTTSILSEDGALLPAWSALIRRYPDRFLFGMDITGDARHLRMAELVHVARGALGALPRPVEEQVAHGNLQRLIRGCRAG